MELLALHLSQRSPSTREQRWRLSEPLAQLRRAGLQQAASEMLGGALLRLGLRPRRLRGRALCEPVEQVEPLEPVELDATGGMAPAGREPRTSAGFRFEQLDNIPTQSQGAMDNEPLVRFAILYGGRALTAITLCSLVFYVYVGLSGGITDGFDRYQEPIEDIRVTMQREGMDGFSPL